MSKLLSEEKVFKGPRFEVSRKIYKREDGLEYVRDCVEPGNAVVILPITEKNEVVFVKQLREVVGKVTLELPAGMIDENEKSENTARRELLEETGLNAKKVDFLTSYYPSCGYTSEKILIFVAKDFTQEEQKFDETEEILSVEKIPIDECLKMVQNNEFEHASVNVAILMYYFKYINGGINGVN